MKAGLELDALVAEKVMGLKVRRGDFGLLIAWNKSRGWYPIAPYSTDIAAAREVVEKLSETTKQYWRLEYFSTGAVATFEEYDSEYQEDADTMPLAICLAALKAKGVDV